jgi:DNA-directed RNA polymerase specialized sigma subunit
LLSSPHEVIRCLITYTDWWQVTSTSVIQVGNARRSKNLAEGFRQGLLESLDERGELCRRMSLLTERDRKLLFLWYVKQLPMSEVAREVGISRRQCSRRRSKAIQNLVDSGERAA